MYRKSRNQTTCKTKRTPMVATAKSVPPSHFTAMEPYCDSFKIFHSVACTMNKIIIPVHTHINLTHIKWIYLSTLQTHTHKHERPHNQTPTPIPIISCFLAKVLIYNNVYTGMKACISHKRTQTVHRNSYKHSPTAVDVSSSVWGQWTVLHPQMPEKASQHFNFHPCFI